MNSKKITNIKNNRIDFRNAFFDQIYEISKKNKKIVFLTADISAYSLPKFKKKFPKKFYNVGIAEQGMINIASGMAMNEKKVFIFSMIPFLTMRCYEHIKINICSHNLPVVMVGLGSGLSYDTVGHSAQAIFDIGVMRMLPELSIYNPSDSISAGEICHVVSKLKNPSYVRLDKSQQPQIYSKTTTFKENFKLISNNAKNCIITTGVMVHKALKIKDLLAKFKISVTILDLYKIKPINEKKFIKTISKFKEIAILDENTFSGGISSLISEILIKANINKKFNFFTLKNSQDVGNYGSREWLHKRNGLDNDTLVKKIKKIFKK